MGHKVLIATFILILAIAIVEGAPKRRVPVETGPDLPYPCWVVRWYASMYTVEQLEEMGKANGIVLSRKQRRQAMECLV